MNPTIFKGFYISFVRLLMRKNMIWLLLKGLFYTYLAILFALCWNYVDFRPFRYAIQLAMSAIWANSLPDSLISLDIGEGFHQYRAIEAQDYLLHLMNPSIHKIEFFGLISLSIFLLTVPIPFILKRISRMEFDPELVRGADWISEKEYNKKVLKLKEPYLQTGSLLIPFSMETEHLIVFGKSKAGKTTLISQAFEQLKARGGHGIVYDSKGTYIERFYDPAVDLLFNPTDERCMGFNVFSQLEDVLDIATIGGSTFPDNQKERDPYWRISGRSVMTSLLHYLWQAGKRTNKDIWEAICADAEDIRKNLHSIPQGKAGFRHVEGGKDGQIMNHTGGVLSSMMQFMAGFEYLQDIQSGPSLREWVTSGKGWIFISNTKKVETAIRPILTLFIDLIGHSFLDLTDDLNRRFYFILDELPTLHPLSTIQKLLDLSRSRGGSVWLGAQDIAQLWSLYGREETDTMFNNTGTKIILRTDGPDSLQYLSRYFGDRQIIETSESFSMSTSDRRDGFSLNRQKRTEPVILPSEISGLPYLQGFARMGPDLTRIQLTPKSYPTKNIAFILRKNLKLNPKQTLFPEDPLSF
jgi:type IV secretory pathway TraG/TraD family ATPase VirD4